MTTITKVRLTFTVEVDLDAWGEEYELTGRQAIREDVARYLLTMVQDCPASEDHLIVSARLT